MDSKEPILWLPRDIASQPPEPPNQLPIRTVLTLGSLEVLGKPATFDEAADLLAGYSLGEALEMCGRLSAILANLEPPTLYEAQLPLFSALAGREADVEEAFARLVAKNRTEHASESLLFNEIGLLTLAKIALLTMEPRLETRIDRNFDDFATAALMANDLVVSLAPEFQELGAPGDEGVHRRLLYVLANGLFNSTRNRMMEFVRSHELYLKGGPEGGVAKRVHSVTGFDAETTWFALLAMHE